MKVPLMLAVFSAALAFPAVAEELQSATGDSNTQTQLEHQGMPLKKVQKLMIPEVEKPSWQWDDSDCGSYPDDQISLRDVDFASA